MKRHPQHILTHTETETWTNITVQGFTTFWPREQYASRSIILSGSNCIGELVKKLTSKPSSYPY